MTDTFNYPLQAGSAATVKHRTRKAQFGDGYSQGVGDGVNVTTKDWNVKFWGVPSVIDPIRTFLDTHHEGNSFYWTPPRGVQGYYVCNGYTETPGDADQVTITALFEQVFRP